MTVIKTKINQFKENLVILNYEGSFHLRRGNNPKTPQFDPKWSETEVDEKTFYSDLGKKLDHQMVPIQPNDPFYGSDLIVFRDSYKGHLPLNGIKEKDFLKTKQLYSDIISGKTKIQFTNELSSEDKNSLCADICILLTRDVGRKLLDTVCKADKKLLLQTSTTSKITFAPKTLEPLILVRQESNYVFAKKTDAKSGSYLIPNPSFFSLAHELIHHYHDITTGNSLYLPPTLGPEFTNLEEQYTIVGVGKPEYGYEEINESRVRMAFQSPPRCNHYGTYEITPFKITKANGEAEIARQMRMNNIAYVKKYLTKENVNQFVTPSGEHLIEIAAKSGSPEMMELILRNLPQEMNSSKSFNRLLDLAKKNKKVSKILINEMKRNYPNRSGYVFSQGDSYTQLN